MKFHVHHLTPKYDGGDDSPENRIRVNVAMHAFLHNLRYLEKGDKRDLLAAQGLLGIKGKEEIWAELSARSRRFSGKTHTEQWKADNSQLHVENWKTRDKAQIQSLGRGGHKRNTSPGRAAAAKTGHPFKRSHWEEDLFNEVKERYENRTSYHWGRKEVCEKYGVTAKTVENMVKHIREGKTYLELTRRAG